MPFSTILRLVPSGAAALRLAIGVLACATSAVARPAVEVSFDGPLTRWQVLDDDPTVRVVVHECVPEGADQTEQPGGSERIVLTGTAGRSIFLACAIGRMPVLDEWHARLWVRASLPGVQLGARVVLPRSVDTRTGEPITVIVRGAQTTRPGQWQRLELTGVAELLADEVRILRAATVAAGPRRQANGGATDAREAYVDAILLIVPGQPQGAQVLTDNLEVEGVLIEPAHETDGPHRLTEVVTDGTAGTLEAGQLPSLAAPSGRPRLPSSPAGQGPALPASPIRLQATTLLVEGRAFVPRAIEWNGEPLEFLAARGFNVVILSQPPTAEQAAQAQQHGLWFIAPPPPERQALDDRNSWSAERVLAWLLDDPEAQDDPAYYRRWADTLRRRDGVSERPLLVPPSREWAALSHPADILLARHPHFGRISDEEYAAWMTSRRRSSRPGTPIWASIDTQSGEAARVQAASVSGQASPSLAVEDGQIERLVRVAYAQGCRGFLFRSHSRLDGEDLPTRRRAALLELVNRRLQLVGPWIARGNVVGQIESTDRTMSAIVMAVDRARLLVPVSKEREASEEVRMTNDEIVDPSIVGRPAAADLRHSSFAHCSFVIPGVPDSSRIFLMSSAVFRPLPTKRVAGGTRVALDAGDEAFLVITEDPQAILSLRGRIAQEGPEMVRLERELTGLQFNAAASTGKRLALLGYPLHDADGALAAASEMLGQADSLVAADRVESALSLIGATRQRICEAVQEHRRLVGRPAALGSYPLGTAYATLCEHAEFLRHLELLRGGDNLLHGGDFEDVGQLTRFGWRNLHQPSPHYNARVELSSAGPRQGRYCLRLVSQADSEGVAASIDSQPPIWIASPPIHVEGGSLVEITGWVRVPPSNQGELAIIDSLGGEEMSVRVSATGDWQPFQVVRASPQPHELVVSFALAGSGVAEIDAVMVRVLGEPLARRLPPTVR